MMNKEMLSQEEIDLLLKGKDNGEVSCVKDKCIDELEMDAIGEIGNISMGTAATTLSTLLNKKVTITTPKVEATSASELVHEFPVPFVAVDVRYKQGLEGSNVLIINEDDVKVITDIMMGNEVDKKRQLTELDLSAISEVMNQMMGSAATSLSEMLSKRIDIEPPMSYNITIEEGQKKLEVLNTDEPIIKVTFKILVEDIIDSMFVQLIPMDFGLEMVENLLKDSNPKGSSKSDDKSIESKNDQIQYKKEMNQKDKANTVNKNSSNNANMSIDENVVVKEPKFETFDNSPKVNYNEPIDLVGDIPVELTVELGRTVKKIGEILEYGPGTVVELDKLVGEPLNVYANGKFIARGEVVVIDDNFGIRITDIENNRKKE